MKLFGHRHEWEEVRATAEDDLVGLGEDIRALDIDIQMPGAPERAKARYGQAVEAYQRASQIFDRARSPEDLAPVSSTLEEGRYAMAAAHALLEGRPEPERRPPCFFDPRHGPSVENVEWAPPGGAPRPVPACAADALRIKEGFDPHGRLVPVGGRQVEYWNAPGYYGPYAGGFFGGFGGGGLLGALLTGSALGAGMGIGEEIVGDLFGGGGGDWDDGGGGGFFDNGPGWDDGGDFDDGGGLW